jgi:hypothetical protein
LLYQHKNWREEMIVAYRTKLILTLFIIIISASFGHAQNQQTTRTLTVFEHESETETREIIRRIVNVVGLKPNFEIRAGNVLNAAAIISKGRRFIIYNPEFMEKIKTSVNTDWGGIAIIAHEVGHHLNGHTLAAGGSKPETELEADVFVGFVLRKMGASLVQAQVGIFASSSENGSKTHPPRSMRLASIEAGWKKADEQLAIANTMFIINGGASK